MVLGGFVLVSLGLTLLFDEDYLALELTEGRSVAYYVGVATLGMAVATACVPDDARAEPAPKLAAVAQRIQHFPDAWKNREGHPDTCAEVKRLFPSKLAVLLKEAAAAFLAPFALLGLAQQAHAIACFFERTTRRCPVVGDVCAHAAFEPAAQAPVRRKVELSLVSFKREYPRWSPVTEWQASTIDEEPRVVSSVHA